MKNNKGFAVSTMLYGLSIMGLLIVIMILSIMSSNRYNTKEIVKTIEEELNKYSGTSANISSNSSFNIPNGEGGWYKIELFGAATGTADANFGGYHTFVIYLPQNTTVYFNLGNPTKVHFGSNNSATVLADSTNATVNDATQQTDEYNPTTNKFVEVSVTGSSTKYNYWITRTNHNTSGRATITQIVKGTSIGTVVTDPTAGNGNFYILTTNGQGTATPYALTVNKTASTDYVTWSKFEAKKTQQWTITRHGTTNEFYISNAENGNALESNTETVRIITDGGDPDMESNDYDVIADQKINTSIKYMRWEIGKSGSQYTFRSLKFSSPSGYLCKSTKSNNATFRYKITPSEKFYLFNSN